MCASVKYNTLVVVVFGLLVATTSSQDSFSMGKLITGLLRKWVWLPHVYSIILVCDDNPIICIHYSTLSVRACKEWFELVDVTQCLGHLGKAAEERRKLDWKLK